MAESAAAARVERAVAEAELAWLRVRIEELQTGLGHDLRSPLAIISGHSQLLEAGAVAPGQLAATATTLRRQAHRLNTMLDEQLARVRALPPTSRGDQGDCITIATSIIRPFLDQRGLMVQVEGSSAIPGTDRAAVLLVALVLEGLALLAAPGGRLLVRAQGDRGVAMFRPAEQSPVASRNAAESVWAIAARLAAESGAILELGEVEVDLRLPAPGDASDDRDPATGLPVLALPVQQAPFGPAPMVLLEVAELEAFQRDGGAGATEEVLGWLSRVVYRVFAGQPLAARLPGPRLLVRRPLGEDNPGEEWRERVAARLSALELSLASARPRIGGHRLRVHVRARVFDASTLEAHEVSSALGGK